MTGRDYANSITRKTKADALRLKRRLNESLERIETLAKAQRTPQEREARTLSQA